MSQKGACPVCAVNKAYPLTKEEELTAFSVGLPFIQSDNHAEVTTLLQEVFAPFIKAEKVCFHPPSRFSLRGTREEHATYAQERNQTDFQVLVDVLLREGSFHPSQVKPVVLD